MADLCVIADVQALTQTTYGAGTKPTSTEVSAWITAVSAWLEERTGYKFVETTATGETHDGTGTCFFMTDHYPITSVTSLVVDDSTLTENTDFWIEDKMGGLIELLDASVERLESYTGGRKSIIIAYKYCNTSIPQTIKEMCATITALKAINAGAMAATSSGAIESYTDGDISIKYAKEDAIASGLIRRYEELKKILPAKLIIIGGAP